MPGTKYLIPGMVHAIVTARCAQMFGVFTGQQYEVHVAEATATAAI